MAKPTRRRFLANVGQGMLAGSLGSALALDLGVAPVFANEGKVSPEFGELEPLVALLQETPLNRLQKVLVSRLASGVDLRTLIAAGTLANASSFVGQDYIGFHTFMALAPALDMSERLPKALKPLPVLKVLYRNTERIQAAGARTQPLTVANASEGPAPNGLELRNATRAGDQAKAERVLAAMSDQTRGEMFNHVQYSVQDAADVHRVVLSWRAWLAVDLVGEQHAQLLLRQSVRYCTDVSQRRISRKLPDPELWKTLPALLDQYKLLGKPPGKRRGDDRWVEDLAFTIFTSSPTVAADAAAQALAEGFERESVGEAISLAANLQLLHDPGRPKAANGDKVIGSVHGDSVGVHASDAANAWRNIARVSSDRNAIISLLLGANFSAGTRRRMPRDPWPLKRDEVQRMDQAKSVLAIADQAVRAKDQALAGAAVDRYRELGGSSKEVFDVMLRFATSEDGALHAEKYYRTVTEEFATTRPSLRWRQLIGLARVSASEYGLKSPGYREACDLLGVEV